MTISEAREAAGSGAKVCGVVIGCRVAGTVVVNAAGEVIGFWANGHKEPSPLPPSVLGTASLQPSHGVSAE
jgi:hypothetical protein